MLAAMILLAGPHTSASLNPAVSICLTVLDVKYFNDASAKGNFMRVYMAGPILGAVLAGFFSILNRSCLKNHTPPPPSEHELEMREKLFTGEREEENKAKTH